MRENSPKRLNGSTVAGTCAFLALLISAVIFLIIATTAEPDQTVGTSETVKAGLVEAGPSVGFRLAVISLVMSVIGLIAIGTWRLATQNGTIMPSKPVSNPKRDERGRSIVETLFMMAGGLSAIQLLVIVVTVRASPRADSPINQWGTAELLIITGFLSSVMILGVYAFYSSFTRDRARRSVANEPAADDQVEPGQPGSAA